MLGLGLGFASSSSATRSSSSVNAQVQRQQEKLKNALRSPALNLDISTLRKNETVQTGQTVNGPSDGLKGEAFPDCRTEIIARILNVLDTQALIKGKLECIGRLEERFLDGSELTLLTV